MVSSASAQIETTAGANIKTPEGRPNYAKVGAILIGVVAAWIILCCLIGREAHGSHFEKGKAAFEQGAGNDEIEEREFGSSILSVHLHDPSLTLLSPYSRRRSGQQAQLRF